MHECDELAGIEAGPAAKSNDAVVVTVFIRLHPGMNVALDRIGPDIGKHRNAELRFPEIINDILNHRHGREPWIGYEQRPLNAIVSAVIGKLLNPACAEFDRCRKSEIAVWDRHDQPVLFLR